MGKLVFLTATLLAFCVSPTTAIDFRGDEVLCAFTDGPTYLLNGYAAAALLTPPGVETRGQAEIMFANGFKMWTRFVLPSHKAQKEELHLGQDILYIYGASHLDVITEDIYRFGQWYPGRITGLDELFKGVVEVNGYKLFLKWLRVSDRPMAELDEEEPPATGVAAPARAAAKTASAVAPLEVASVAFSDIFPVLRTYYDTHPVGTAVLRNTGSETVTDLSVRFYVERYMDNPKKCDGPTSLRGGEPAQIELYALFTDEILAVTEATKVSYKLSYEYTLKGKRETGEYTESMRVYDRNAITWDDSRRVAAFVTARDPAVLQFSKNVMSWTKGKASPALNANLCTAMALHEALRLSGMTYVVDPKTPFATFSASSGAVDFLQFPRHTLIYKAGDCDDLSILYAALLESVGIETAFVTIPGHIFVAFSLGIPAAEARKTFLKADELIYGEGSSWVPVEVTMTQSPFLDA
jgi:hypothetical protein